MGMDIDDHDTMDYGLVAKDEPLYKLVEAWAAAKEIVLTITCKVALSVAEREQLRLHNIKRNKEIVCLDRICRKLVNTFAGFGTTY